MATKGTTTDHGDEHPADVPFSLVCSECDAGMDIAGYDHAVAEGWTEIDYAPDLPMANFIGVCPDCRERFEHWPAAKD